MKIMLDEVRICCSVRALPYPMSVLPRMVLHDLACDIASNLKPFKCVTPQGGHTDKGVYLNGRFPLSTTTSTVVMPNCHRSLRRVVLSLADNDPSH